MPDFSEHTLTPEEEKRANTDALTTPYLKKLLNFYHLKHEDEMEEFKRNVIAQMRIVNKKLKAGQLTKADKEVTHFLSIVKQGKAIKSGWDGIFGSAPTQDGNQNGPFSVKKSLEKK